MKNIFTALAVLLFLFADFGYSQATNNFSSESEIGEQMKLVKCSRSERLESVKDLFIKAGAAPSEIKVEKLKSAENLIVELKGKSDEIIVVGAHYDKTDEGCGAIDNWSGIVILANLYKTLKNYTTEKTYQFVAFDREEEGLIGSDEFSDAIPKEKRSKYCAMVNFDSFGFTYPQALRNISDRSLIKLAEAVSKEMKMPFSDAGIDFASSDSESFRRKKIPAISMHGLNNRWQGYLHGSGDKLDNVNVQSVFIGYRHGLVLLSKIDSQPCGAFR